MRAALHVLSHGKRAPVFVRGDMGDPLGGAGRRPLFVDQGDQGVNDAKWLPAGGRRQLVTASGNGSVALWDVGLGTPPSAFVTAN
eukprot:768868-Pyramimonas_sp.AAC.1